MSDEARTIEPDKFSKDHWSTFAYALVCYREHGGRLDPKKLRLDGKQYPTKLDGHFNDDVADEAGTEKGHNDLDCLRDCEAAGLIEMDGRVVANVTDLGHKVHQELIEFKNSGGNYAHFEPETLAKNGARE